MWHKALPLTGSSNLGNLLIEPQFPHQWNGNSSRCTKWWRKVLCTVTCKEKVLINGIMGVVYLFIKQTLPGCHWSWGAILSIGNPEVNKTFELPPTGVGRGDWEWMGKCQRPMSTLLWSKQQAVTEDSQVFSGRLLRPGGQEGPHHLSILTYDIPGLLLNWICTLVSYTM